MTDSEKVAAITHVLDVHERQTNSEDDLYPDLADDEGYVMEAISAIINDWPESPIVRQFLEAR